MAKINLAAQCENLTGEIIPMASRLSTSASTLGFSASGTDLALKNFGGIYMGINMQFHFSPLKAA